MPGAQELDFEVGLDVRDMLVRLVAYLRSVATLTFIQLPPTVSLAEESRKETESYDLVFESSQGRRSVWLPRSWLLFTRQMGERRASWQFLERAVQHDERQHERVIRTTLARDEISFGQLEALRTAKPDWVLAMSSAVTLASGERCHLPMMDFQCPQTEAYLACAVAGLQAVGRASGVMIGSGQSFHYYGFELLPQAEWRRFLFKCLLLSPLADERYIGHRLLDDECVLRIAASPHKRVQPTVARVFQNTSRNPTS